MWFAQIRLAARYLAISSKKSMWALKKKLRRGANSSTERPAAIAASTYAKPFARVKAISCAAVEPASRMWYPEIDTGCQRGISEAQKRITSVTSRTDGRGGKTYSFWAWYSFRMSFWSVPERSARRTPVRSATPTYMARTGAAGELMVMEVETVPRSMPEKRHSMSASVSTATPARPTSPLASGSSESRPSNVGMSNAVDNPSPPARSNSLNRALVSAAVPNPANWRMVHSRERYMDAYGPRVYGNCPGSSAPSGP